MDKNKKVKSLLRKVSFMPSFREDIIKIKQGLINGLQIKIEKASAETKRLEKNDFAFSNLRLVIFSVILFSIWLFLNHDEFTGALVGINSAIAFAGVVYYHNIIFEKLKKTRAGLVLARERKARCEENIEGHKDAEKFFVKEIIDHPALAGGPMEDSEGGRYEISGEILNDLDFYGGDANLFSLYNTAQTSVGIKKFYNYLKTPLLNAETIKNRQGAVKELAGSPDFIDAAMLELYHLRGRRFSEFVSAIISPRVLPHNVFFKTLLIALSISAVASLAAGYYNAFALIYCFNFAIIAIFFEKCAAVKKNYLSMSYFARPFANLSEMFYRSGFDSDILKKLSAAFDGRKSFSEPKIGRPFHKKLGVIARIADFMLIPMPIILDAIILSELLLCERIERKTSEIKDELIAFIEALGEFESLASLANIKIDLPEYNFAEIISDGPQTLKVSGAIHPLIKFDKAVENGIVFDEHLDIAIITGSNMSGKSTFLKSVAISVVLSQIGAPARVEKMELTPFVLLTDIRITDSIKAGVSHFYSELLRVKAVTDKLDSVKNVFAIFDELFHGTNSRERLALCRATLEYFQKSGGKFVMATHDKELTSLGDSPEAPAVKNYHFEEKIEGLDSFFTYRLIKGPVTAVNAVKLAQKCGLPEEIYKRAAQLS